LVFGVVAAVVGVGVPAVLITVAVKGGVIADRFISDSSKRWPFAVVMVLLLFVAGAIVYALGGAPLLLWAVAVVLLCVVLVGVVSLFWKISAHATITGLVAGVFSLSVPWYGLLVWVLPLVVGWSRVYLRAHTVLQVVAGVVGGVVVSLTFLLVP
jgi:membrane-associated phospholipid phosphatase